MSECIACKYSGVDEAEYRAHGCPACTCSSDESKSYSFGQMLDDLEKDRVSGKLKDGINWPLIERIAALEKERDELAERLAESEDFIKAVSFTSLYKEFKQLREGQQASIGLLNERAKEVFRLRSALERVLEMENCGETSCPLPMRAMCSNPMHQMIRKALRGEDEQ